MDRETLDALSQNVIGAFFEISNSLGTGFLEKVYEKALMRELGIRGIAVESQVPFSVFYKGLCVGEYFADLMVGGAILVELKCVDRFSNEHTAQCLNYLKASGLKVCLLVNFQKTRVEWKRVVVDF